MTAEQVQHPRLDAKAEEQAHHLRRRLPRLPLVQGADRPAGQAVRRLNPPPAESVASAPELATRFPLQLVSPPSPHFLNSTFANVPSLKSAAGEPEIEIHTDDAAARGITDGDPVRIHNDRGWFRAKASVGDSVRDGVVVATGIWWNKHVEGGWNANATTPTRLADLGGGSTLFDNLVEVESLES